MQSNPLRRPIHRLVLIRNLQAFSALAGMAYVKTLGRLVYVIVAETPFVKRIGFRIESSGCHTDEDSLLFLEILQHLDPSQKEN